MTDAGEVVDGSRCMEFWVTLVGVVRRKQVLVPALAVALALGVLGYALTPPSYVSRTTMVLTLTPTGGSESRDPAVPTDLTNPMLNFNDSLTTTSAILINAMNVDEVADQLDPTGSTDLVVDDGRSNPDLLGLNGPFLHIRVESTSRATAARVDREAQALMRDKLEEWQVELDAPQSTYIRLVDVVPTGAPEVDHGAQRKYAVLAALLGGGATVALAYLLHQLRARRRGRDADDELTLENLPSWEPHVDERDEERDPPRVRRTLHERVLVPDDRIPEQSRPPTTGLSQSPWKKGTNRRTGRGR